MIVHKPVTIIGQRVLLKTLAPDDASSDYLSWLNDPEVTRFLECRFMKHTMDSLRSFIKDAWVSPRDYLFGIYLIHDNRHIGNIKIGGMEEVHSFADLGLMIGDKSEWGKGYGAEAIGLATSFAFDRLGLFKIFAGVYATNDASVRSFLKAGYREAGRLLHHRVLDEIRVDQILLEKLRDY